MGIVAPKNTWAELAPVLSSLSHTAEPYRRGGEYDLVWFFNLTPEIRFAKRHSGADVFGLAVEPPQRWGYNYDPELLASCDLYMGYRNFAGPRFAGEFAPFVFPAATAREVEEQFDASWRNERSFDFCLFARHDPNLRCAIAEALAGRRAVLAGPLFGNPTADKLALQRQARFEFITENEINDFYFSEKLGQALLAGCVPIYYGCREIKRFVPEELFIDLTDFADGDLRSALPRVIEHCLAPGVYEQYAGSIRAHGKDFLRRSSTYESNVVAPLEEYLSTRSGPSRSGTWLWKAHRIAPLPGPAAQRLSPAGWSERLAVSPWRGRTTATPRN